VQGVSLPGPIGKGELKMDNKVVKIIIALFIPPLAVYLHEGKIGKNFWIDLVLWVLLFGIGGIIYALYIILK
jgi:uncharacterized membrane protein YqaE (UPF0057 family)